MKKVLLGAVCVLFLQHAMGMEKKVDDGKLTDSSSDVVGITPRVNLEQERVKNMEIFANVRHVAEKLATFIRFFQEQGQGLDVGIKFDNIHFGNWYIELTKLANELIDDVPSESFMQKDSLVQSDSNKKISAWFDNLCSLAITNCKAARALGCNYNMGVYMALLYEAIDKSRVAKGEMDNFQTSVSEKIQPRLVRIAQDMYSSDEIRKILFTEVDHSKDSALNGLVECFRGKGVKIKKVLLLNPVHKGEPVITGGVSKEALHIGCLGALSPTLIVKTSPEISSFFDPLENVLYLGLEQLQTFAPYCSIMSIKAKQKPEKEDGRFIYGLPGIAFIPNHEACHASNDVADALYDLIATPQDKENTLRNMSAYSGGTVNVREDLLNKGLDSVPNESFLVKGEYAVSRENISDFLKNHAWEWMQGNASEKSQILSGKFWGNYLVLNKDRNDIIRFEEIGKAQQTTIPFRMDHDYPNRKDGVEVTGDDFVTCLNENPLNFVEFRNITPDQPVIDALRGMYRK